MISTLTPQQRRLAAGIVAVLGLVAWWQFLAGPQWRAIAKMRPEAHRLARQIRDVREGLAQMPAMKAQQETLRGQLKAYPRPLVQERLPAIMDELAALAKHHQVTVEVVRPAAKPAKAGQEKKPKSKKAAEAPAEREAASFTLEIRGQAGYHEIGQFLEALERAEQLYGVRTLAIEAVRKTPARHKLAVTVEAYVAVTLL